MALPTDLTPPVARSAIPVAWGDTVQLRAVNRFPDVATRTAQLPAGRVAQGQVSWVDTLGRLDVYDGTRWRPVAAGVLGWSQLTSQNPLPTATTRVAQLAVPASMQSAGGFIDLTGQVSITNSGGLATLSVAYSLNVGAVVTIGTWNYPASGAGGAVGVAAFSRRVAFPAATTTVELLAAGSAAVLVLSGQVSEVRAMWTPGNLA